MRIPDAKEFIKKVASANCKVPVMMMGSMGIGKSQIVDQAARELTYDKVVGGRKETVPFEFIDLRLAQQEPGDLIGIPRVNPSTGFTEWAKPAWWPKEGTKGILFLDELNRAPTDVRQAVFQLVKEHRLHTHQLPDGWMCVSAVNPDNNNYQVETLDPAMLRRFCVIKVTADVESWLKWAHASGKVDSSVTGFIAAHRKLLGVDEEFSIDTKPTPDQWAMLDRIRKSGAIDQHIEIEVFTGLVGNEAAIAFRKFLDTNYKRPVTGEEILNNYHDKPALRKKAKEQRNDENHQTMLDLTALMSSIKKPTQQQVDNLAAYIKDVTPEIQTSVVHRLPREWMTELVKNREVTQLIADVCAKSREA